MTLQEILAELLIQPGDTVRIVHQDNWNGWVDTMQTKIGQTERVVEILPAGMYDPAAAILSDDFAYPLSCLELVSTDDRT